MDGFEAARAMRAWEKEQGRSPATIVAPTACALPDEAAAGCDNHLPKPVSSAARSWVLGDLSLRSA